MEAKVTDSFEDETGSDLHTSLLAGVLEYDVATEHIFSFTFPYMASVMAQARENTVITVIGWVLLYIASLIMMFFFNNVYLWDSTNPTLDSIVDFFRTIYDPKLSKINPYNMFGAPPFVTTVVLAVISIFGYVSALSHAKGVFLPVALHTAHICFCYTFAPFFGVYTVVVVVNHLGATFMSGHSQAAINMILVVIAIIPVPLLVLVLAIVFGDVRHVGSAWGSSDPRMAVNWFATLLVMVGISSLMYCVRDESALVYQFLSVLIVFFAVWNTFRALRRFFLSRIAQAMSIAMSLIAAVNSVIAFFSVVFTNFDSVTAVSLMCGFDVVLTVGSIVYVLWRRAQIRTALSASAIFDAGRFTDDELLLLFSETDTKYTQEFIDGNTIGSLLSRQNLSFRLEILLVQFLLTHGVLPNFVYARSLRLLERCSGDFLMALQCVVMGIHAAEHVSSKRITMQVKRYHFAGILSDCLWAETQFWKEVLTTYTGDTVTAAANLFSHVKDARDFFTQVDADLKRSSKYSLPYIDFMMHVSCDYEQVAKILVCPSSEADAPVRSDEEEDGEEDHLHRVWLTRVAASCSADDIGMEDGTLRVSANACEAYPALKRAVMDENLITKAKRRISKMSRRYDLEPWYMTRVVIMVAVAVMTCLFSFECMIWHTVYFVRTVDIIPGICSNLGVVCNYSHAVFAMLARHVDDVSDGDDVYSQTEEDLRRILTEARTVDVTQNRLSEFVSEDDCVDLLDDMETWMEKPSFDSASDCYRAFYEDGLVQKIDTVLDGMLLAVKTGQWDVDSNIDSIHNIAWISNVCGGGVFFLLLVIMLIAAIMTYRSMTNLFCVWLSIPKDELSRIYFHYRNMAMEYSGRCESRKDGKSVISFRVMLFIKLLLPIVVITAVTICTTVASEQLTPVLRDELHVACRNVVTFPFMTQITAYNFYLLAKKENDQECTDVAKYNYRLLNALRFIMDVGLGVNESDLMEWDGYADVNEGKEADDWPVYGPGYGMIDISGSGDDWMNSVMYWMGVEEYLYVALDICMNVQRYSCDWDRTAKTVASSLKVNQYSDEYVESIVIPFDYKRSSVWVEFLVVVSLSMLVSIVCLVVMLVTIWRMDQFYSYVLRLFALVPNTHTVEDYGVFRNAVKQGVLQIDHLSVAQELPVGLMLTDDSFEIVWANDYATNTYNVGQLVGTNIKSLELDKTIDDDGMEHTYSVISERLKRSPFHGLESLSGTYLYIVTETTDRDAIRKEINALTSEIQALRGYILQNRGSMSENQSNEPIFIKQYIAIEIDMPDTLPIDVSERLHDDIRAIVSTCATLFHSEISQGSTFFVFSSTNVKLHQRQHVRDSMICGQRIFESLKGREEYKDVKMAICNGADCCVRMSDGEKVFVALHSQGLLKTSSLLNCISPGQMAVETTLLNSVSGGEANTIEIRGTNCYGGVVNYCVMENGVSFVRGFVNF